MGETAVIHIATFLLGSFCGAIAMTFFIAAGRTRQ